MFGILFFGMRWMMSSHSLQPPPLQPYEIVLLLVGVLVLTTILAFAAGLFFGLEANSKILRIPVAIRTKRLPRSDGKAAGESDGYHTIVAAKDYVFTAYGKR